MKPLSSEFESVIRSGKSFECPPELREWLNRPQTLFVEGEVSLTKTFPTYCPATGEALSQIPLADKKVVQMAVKTARTVFEKGDWSSLSLLERSKVIRLIGDVILKHKMELAILESLDTGKPIRETLEGDIPRAAQNFQFFADFALEQKAPSYQNGLDLHETMREPLGVVALITPWNLPLYLETWKIAPALLMGNSVILKPSELTPLTAQYLAEILSELPIPRGVFQVVQGFGENSTGEFLVSDPGIDAVSFTGETGTGRAIMKAASVGPTRVSFELGGKGASVVFDDADLENVFSETIRAGFRNQGEICLACPRVFVERSLYNRFVEEYTARVKNIRLGHPLDWSTDMGSLISPEHQAKVMGYIKQIPDTATVWCGGQVPASLKGAYVSPTVVTGLDLNHPISKEEVFGPLVAIYPFDTDAEVIQMVNNTPYGLSASLYSKDLRRMETVAKKLRVGMLWVNGWFRRDLRVPFGGQKRSGLGREGGEHSLDFFSEWKSLCWVGGKA